jgi:hypothetical protein
MFGAERMGPTAGVTSVIIVRKVTQLRRLSGASDSHVTRRVKLYYRNLQNLAVKPTILHGYLALP